MWAVRYRRWMPRARGRAAAFEWIASPAIYRNAAIVEGRIYLAGPTGIWEYNEGLLEAEYLVGTDLPAAEPIQIASGLARGAFGPVVYFATAGEGLLIYDPRRETFTQVRADQPRYRDLTAVLPLKTGTGTAGYGARGCRSSMTANNSRRFIPS